MYSAERSPAALPEVPCSSTRHMFTNSAGMMRAEGSVLSNPLHCGAGGGVGAVQS